MRRNLKSINKLLDAYTEIPLDPRQHKYLFVINTLYEQQQKMFEEKTHSIEHRIVSIHQPHVRPIVRGKTNANVEFGAKINVHEIGFLSIPILCSKMIDPGYNLAAEDIIREYDKKLQEFVRKIISVVSEVLNKDLSDPFGTLKPNGGDQRKPTKKQKLLNKLCVKNQFSSHGRCLTNHFLSSTL